MVDTLPYLFVFFLVFVINCCAIKQKKNGMRKFLISLGFLILLFFIGFRFGVGTDYDSYLDMYNKVAATSWEELGVIGKEMPVLALFKVCSLLSMDGRLIFLVLGFFLLWPIYRINKIYDYKYLAYSILLFCVLFLPFSLNGVRQGIAMAFVLLSIVHGMKGNIAKSILSVLAASAFHVASLVVLPYVALIIIRRKYRRINFALANILITVFVSVIIVFFLNDILLESGFERYSYILGNIDIGKISFSNALLYLPIMLFTLVFADKDEKNGEDVILKNLFMDGMLFCVVGAAANFLYRLSLYFLLACMVLVPKQLQRIQDDKIRIAMKISLMVYVILLFYIEYSVLGWHEILPYQTWLFENIV